MLRAFKFKVRVVLGFRPRGLSDWAVPRVLRGLCSCTGLKAWGVRAFLASEFPEKLPGPANRA